MKLPKISCSLACLCIAIRSSATVSEQELPQFVASREQVPKARNTSQEFSNALAFFAVLLCPCITHGTVGAQSSDCSVLIATRPCKSRPSRCM
jgi:hypothetical protein